MRLIVPATLLLVVAAACSSPQRAGWTLDMHIVADPSKDQKVIAEAKKKPIADVHVDGELVARWIPVAPNYRDELKTISSVVTRLNKGGTLELLVLLGPNDVTERDVVRVRADKRPNGEPVVIATFFRPAGKRFGRLIGTAKDQRRRLAAIVNGRVTGAAVPRGVSTIQVGIPGSFSKEDVEKMERNFTPFARERR